MYQMKAVALARIGYIAQLSIAEELAYDIIDDGRGRYWICSYMGGVFIIEKQRLLAATTPVVVADRHIAKQLQGIHVWQLAKDRKGRIYARMYDNGLDRIDPASLRVEHVVGKDRLVNSLISDRSCRVCGL